METTSAQKYNREIRNSCLLRIRNCSDDLKAMSGEHPAIDAAFAAMRAADMMAIRKMMVADIRGEVLTWFTKMIEPHPPEDRPQLIYFEFDVGNRDYGRSMETTSYGISGLEPREDGEMPFFKEPNYAYDFWRDFEACPGYEMSVWPIVDEHVSYELFEEDIFERNTVIGKGYDILATLVANLEELLVHDAFAECDEAGDFDHLQLPTGLTFTAGQHDGGNLIDPFYLKQ